MILKNFSCSILIIALSCLSLNGQTLIQDAKNLLKAIDVLENQTEDTPDSVLIAASSEALALLNFHDQTFEMDSMKTGLWEDIKHSYARNSTINKLIRDPYFSIADSEKSTVLIQSNLFSEKIASGPRQKMLNLLKAEYAVSPSDYLSISSTLEKYRIPPISKIQALKATTANNNNNITNGILTSQAAVIEGLYRFILERAKKEVLINFLEELLNEETPRFRKLFPTVVEEFGNQEFTYSASFIQRLRQAFYEDIQMLSINLPVLFLEDDHFNSLQSSPVSYNFLVIFSMIGLAQHAVPIEEIIPLTHRYLFQNYEEATKVVNLELAEKAPDADSYEELIAISRSIVGQLKIIYNEFDKAEEAIVEAVKASEDNFPDAPSAPFVNDYLSRSEYDLEVILGSGDTGNEFDLSLLPYLLKGELDSAYMAQYNTIASYDHFFEKQYTSREWRAAGLEISNKLAGNWYRGQSITDIFYRWQKDLTHFQLAVDRWKSEIDPDSELQRAIEQTETDRIKLLEVTLASKEFWLPSLSQHNKLAFNSLANLITEDVFFDIDFDPVYITMEELEGINTELLKLDRKKEQLVEVEKRLINLDTLLYSLNPENFRASPVRKYLLSKESSVPYSWLITQVDDLNKEIQTFDTQLIQLEKKFADDARRERNNAIPVLQTTELTANLMYGLRSDTEDQKWLTVSQLDSILDGGRLQDAFLGLLQQRMSSSKGLGMINPGGLAQLVGLTIRDLPELPAFRQDSLQRKDSLAFYRKAAFTVNTMNRILELPLVVKPGTSGKFQPLKEQLPGMQNVPDISKRSLDFIYYLNVKDHGHAISTLIRLFTRLEPVSVYEKADTCALAVCYLKKYGDFISGIIDATSADEVQDLLENISDPPGNSRLKRTSPLTVGINAYLGGTYGWELWQSDILDEDVTFSGFAPSMPIGITVSKLLGKKKASFSAFLSFLDLGTLLTFYPDSDTSGENQLTFKNVFKPGIQLHWNIKKSPFFLGTGVQYGPQYRMINGKSTALGSFRYSIGFGVDVPIKTLYQK